MKKRLLLFLVLIYTAGCGMKASKDYMVTGKIGRDAKKLQNIDVYAYKAASLLDFSKPYAKAKSDESGAFSLRVKEEGDYYITARMNKKGTEKADLYAFYGRNPLYVTKSGVTGINLNMQKISTEIKFEKGEQTGIKCLLTKNGEPVSGAVLYVAVDLNEGMQTKGFTQSDFSGESGECFVGVDKGTYYLTARKRTQGMFGPMVEGDLIGFYHDNPIVIKDNGIYTIGIEMIEIPPKKSIKVDYSSKMMVTGTVIGESGEPVEGIWVGAYTDPQMFGKPVYLSKKSDENGKYTLAIPKAGKYYLAARNTLGGPPGPGELYGSYDGTDDHSVSVEKGADITGIDIKVLEMW